MKQQIKVFLFMERRSDTETFDFKWKPDLWTVKVDDDEHRIFVNEQTVEVEVPEVFDPVPQQIAALEEEKRRITEEFTTKLREVSERLSKLQAITYEVVL